MESMLKIRDNCENITVVNSDYDRKVRLPKSEKAAKWFKIYHFSTEG